MADLDEIAVGSPVRLNELAQQATRLGTGLQNAAPAQEAGLQNPSIKYLLTIADILKKASNECLKLGPKHFTEQ